MSVLGLLKKDQILQPIHSELKMTGPTILYLPTEIHLLIARHLDSLSLLRLKITCRLFRTRTPSLDVPQMLQVEESVFGCQKGLYTCVDCMRLRPRAAFADNMIKKKKAKWASHAGRRFCVDCGTNPRTIRYSRGSHVVIEGRQHVVCLSCGAFREAAVEGGRNMSQCHRCRSLSRAIKQRAEEQRAREERARLQAERAMRRARRRQVWGSDSDYSDDIPPSPTWSELRMDLVSSLW
ncbi:hypothetical protein BDW42DRAFT_57773 [Aspergillus taichungensis]|uniref:F-box domain-containing protein n=1 Tax=Aspergillus taichungensis TaxID=482145 RepID=A0A2J5I2B9_9EURO|nr:hypothetical protein BDW42DRAFT_57773 [Aspergillus taichungensis]